MSIVSEGIILLPVVLKPPTPRKVILVVELYQLYYEEYRGHGGGDRVAPVVVSR